MSYVIYNKETTILFDSKRHKTAGAAKAALTRAEKKAARWAEVDAHYQTLGEGLRFSEIADKMEAAGFTKREAYNARSAGERAVFNRDDYAIADAVDFRDNIEKIVTRRNLMSGEEYEERINTPRYCSPSSEAYWSM